MKELQDIYWVVHPPEKPGLVARAWEWARGSNWFTSLLAATHLVYVLPSIIYYQMGSGGVGRAGFLFTLVLAAIFFVIGELMKPSPNQEQARPANLGDFQFPTATEGRPVPIIFGTIKIKGPNVLWYGDLQQRPITQRVKTGLFSKKTVTTGFKYNVGIQFGICRGETAIRRIWIGEEVVFSGTLSSGATNIDEPGLFGGDEFGNGGVQGTFRFFPGNETQAASSYLSNFQQQGGDTPAYRGESYGVFEKGYVGNSPSVKPWFFEMERFPNGLSFSTAKNELNGGKDLNCASVLYEALTNDEWGMGEAASTIDTVNFSAAGDVFETEGNGFSFQMERVMKAEDLIREVERQTDSIVNIDRATGQWIITLVRPGTTPVGSIDETNLIKVQNFVRGTWEETSNQVRVKYSSRNKDYAETYALSQDNANLQIMGANITADPNYPGIKDDALAVDVSWRDIRTLSYPLAKAALVVDRTFWNVNPGEVVEWSDANLGIVSLDMRVLKVNIGSEVNGQIVLDVVEDIFSSDPASFTEPQPTGWVPPTDDVVDIPAADRVVFEAPKAISDRDPVRPSVSNRLWAGARAQGDNAVQFDVAASGVTEGTVVGFLLAGKLQAAVTRDSTAAIVLKPDPDTQADMLSVFETITDEDKGVALAQLVYIDGEFISVTSAEASGLNVQLNTPTRGMLDSTPAEHAIDDVCYLLFVAGNVTDGTFTSSPVDVELLPESASDKLTPAEATNFDIPVANRDLKPYPPVRPLIAGSEYNSGTVSLDSAVSATDDGLGYTVDFTRRDFRTEDEYLAQLDESTLPADFPANNTTEYRVEVIDDPDGTPTILFLTAWTTGDGTAFAIGRTEILAANAAVVPTRMRIEVQTRHIFDGESTERSADQVLQWDFNVISAELDAGDQVLGTGANGVSLTAFIAATTGNYTLSIGSNILVNGTVEENVNGGGFVPTAITAGVTTDTRAYTSGDSVVYRVNGETPVINLDTILKVDDQAIGDTSDGHGVFTL